MFDLDESGTIDSYEFVCALSLLSHATLDEKAELIFNLYDFDQSQSISKDELTVLMTNSVSSMMMMQGKPPPSINDIKKMTDAFFDKADTNKDNAISLKEFKTYIKTDAQILEVLLSSGQVHKEDLGTDFSGADQSIPQVDEDLDDEINPKGLKNSLKKQRMKEGLDFNEPKDEFAEDDMEEADQFMSVKPWMGVIRNSVPTGFKPSKLDGQAPNSELRLNYIHGFRCHDVRNNLRYTQDGKFAYIAAGVGVVMDQSNNTQKHFMDHTDDIHCIALHPTDPVAATGQIGPKPRLCIWSTETMQSEVLITKPLTKGIKHMAWSPDGRYLVASAMDDDQMMAVWDMQAEPKKGKAREPIAHGKSTRAKIMNLCFSPDSKTIVACCVKELSFLTYSTGAIKGKKGTGWSAESVLAGAYVGNKLFTGAFSGKIYTWQGTGKKAETKAHQGRVNCLFAHDG
jgi:WD40 repeat protein